MERETRITRTGYGNREQQIALYEIKLIGFLWEAAYERADKKVPQGMTEEQWQRTKDIGKAYYYLTLSQGDLGKIYGTTRARIGQICESFIVNLHNNSSDELQSRYPLQEILLRKPMALLRHAPVASRVEQEIKQEGITSGYEIAKRTGLTPTQVRGTVDTLKRYGIEVSFSNYPQFKKLEEQFGKEEDDTKLQEMLDDLPAINTRGFITRNRGKATIFLSFLTNILTGAEFHVRSKELRTVADTIRDAGIPIRLADTGYATKHGKKEYNQVYIIVLTKDKDRILEVIRQNPDLFGRLSDNPVKLAYGHKSDQYPNTTQLTDRNKYGHVGAILRERLGLHHREIRHDDLLRDSPVSIFEMRQSRFYPKDQEDALVAFIEQKLRKMRVETLESKAAI